MELVIETAFSAFSIVLYAVFGIALLIGALVGVKRGLYRTGIKLLANILSIAAAVFLSMLLADTIINAVVHPEFIGNSYGIDNTDVLAGVAASVLAILMFAIVYLVVRLILLIPQHIINKKLPAQYDEAVNADISGAGEAVPSYRDSGKPVYSVLKILWKVSAAALGAVSALVVVGVYVFPLACFMVHTSEPIYEMAEFVPDTATVEQRTVDFTGLKSGYKTVSSHPTFQAVDFLYGKTVYHTLLNVRLEDGNGNLDDFVCTALNAAVDTLPVMLDIRDGSVTDEHIIAMTNAVESLEEDKLTASFAALCVDFFAEQFNEDINAEIASDPELTRCEVELLRAFGTVLENSTAKSLTADMKAAIEILKSFEGSEIFRFFTSEEAPSLTELSKDKLFGEETLGNVFAVAYDAGETRRLVIPMLNLCFEKVFAEAEVAPVYTEVTIDEITKEEFVEEGKRLSRAFDAIARFLESANAEDADITTYDISALGKALDCFRGSVLFGDKYDIIVNNFSQVMKNESDDEQVGEILDIIQSAVTESASAEKVLASTQNILILADELKKGEIKGSENEKIVSALESIKDLDSENDRKVVNDITKEVLDTVVKEDDDMKNEMVADSVNAITEVLDEGTYNSGVEADALQKLYDIANANKDEISGHEKEITDAVLASQIANTLIRNLNEKGENYGVDENLSEENKKNFLDAINSYSADDEKKEAFKKFLGLNR